MADDYGIPWMGSQDPIYGIKRANITDRLTAQNWTKKAVVRTRGKIAFYVYVNREGVQESPHGRKGRFLVTVHRLSGKEPNRYGASFERLEEALAYANGE